MTQAIGAYREVMVSNEFRELERLRADALHNEASALANAERRGYREADEKWQGIVANKNATIADKDAEIAQLRAMIDKG